MTGGPIIELRGVVVPSRWDASRVSAEDVSWTVHEHEFWVVDGWQGSGKSDLMFLLAGLNQPAGGSYTLFGQDMTRHFGDEFLPCRLRLGMVFEDARLFNNLTIADNIALPVRYHNDLHADEVESWVGALLQTTGLTTFANHKPNALARAWQRRAALARALALRPEVLILENPLHGLDARHTSWWMEFLQQLGRGHDLMRGEAITVILSADESTPWRQTDAKFATLDAQNFVVMGEPAPETQTSSRHETIEKGDSNGRT